MKINDVLSELYSFGTKDLVPLTKIVVPFANQAIKNIKF